jgi:Flp pilus assembly protein TadB
VAIALLLTLGGMLLAFLLLEQQVTAASDRWKRAVHLELPVVAEQIGMLLGAGYSLVGALDRVARRGKGAIAQDLRLVLNRIRQGVTEERALREWADLADVDSLDRFVAVLALNREASDLGRLIATEARGIRRDVQRELVETMEKRGQQVWIPVTVATLLPGVIFIAIPFTAALAGFMG